MMQAARGRDVCLFSLHTVSVGRFNTLDTTFIRMIEIPFSIISMVHSIDRVWDVFK